MSSLSGIIDRIRKDMRKDSGTGSDELRILQLSWMIFLKIFSDKDTELQVVQKNYLSPIPNEFNWDNWARDEEGITGNELIEFVDRKLFPSLSNIDTSNGDKRAILIKEVFSNNYNYMKSGIHLRQVINKLNEVNFNKNEDKQIFGEIYEGFLRELQSAGTLGEYYTPRAITMLLAEIIDPKINEKVLDPSCGTGGFLTVCIEHLKKKSKNVSDYEKIQKNIIGWEFKPLPYVLVNANLMQHDVYDPNIISKDSLSRPLADYGSQDEVDIILANPPFGGEVSDNNEKNFPASLRTTESADLFLILIMKLLKKNGRAAIVLPDSSLSGLGVKSRIREKLLNEFNLHTIIRLPDSVFKPYAGVPTNLLFLEKGKKTKEIWFYEHKLPDGYKAYSKTKTIKYEEFNPLKEWWNNRKENKFAWKINISEIESNYYDLDYKNPTQPKPEKIYTAEELTKQIYDSLMESQEIIKKISKDIEND